MTDGRTDGQTDGRTDKILIARPRLHFMQRGKNRFRFAKVIVKNKMSRFYGSLCIKFVSYGIRELEIGYLRNGVAGIVFALCRSKQSITVVSIENAYTSAYTYYSS